MRRGRALFVAAYRGGRANPRPGFALGHLPFAFDHLRSLSRFPMEHFVSGTRLPRDLSGPPPMAAGFSLEPPPSMTMLWLCRWLLFRLMFMSGAVKLLSDDPSWWKLTALTFHYETQPLPTWIGWYAHQLPVWFQKISVAVMFGIELAAPFLILCGRRPRQIACGAFVLLMLLISLTGNYCFFNLLTVALCVLLLDDAFLLRLLPVSGAAFVSKRLPSPAESAP